MSTPWRAPATAAKPRKDAAGAILYAAEKATQMGARGDPGAGRRRLHQRLPDGAALARRQALRDRRRHFGDSPHVDRAGAVRGDRVARLRPVVTHSGHATSTHLAGYASSGVR